MYLGETKKSFLFGEEIGHLTHVGTPSHSQELHKHLDQLTACSQPPRKACSYPHFLSEALRSEVTVSCLTGDLGHEPRSSDWKSGGCGIIVPCHPTRLVPRVIADSEVPTVGPYP